MNILLEQRESKRGRVLRRNPITVANWILRMRSSGFPFLAVIWAMSVLNASQWMVSEKKGHLHAQYSLAVGT